MPFEGLLTDDAAADLAEIVDYAATANRPIRAAKGLGRIEQSLDALNTLSQRCTHPAELLALGIRAFREVFFKLSMISAT
jgi:toxin ParE1/3/4